MKNNAGFCFRLSYFRLLKRMFGADRRHEKSTRQHLNAKLMQNANTLVLETSVKHAQPCIITKNTNVVWENMKYGTLNSSVWFGSESSWCCTVLTSQNDRIMTRGVPQRHFLSNTLGRMVGLCCSLCFCERMRAKETHDGREGERKRECER